MKIVMLVAAFLFLGAVLSSPRRMKDKHELEGDHMTDERSGEVGTATFAGGCFWCVEADFQKIDGVIEAVSGYTGGHTENPTYEEVCSGRTGHVEAVRVTFDPGRVSYSKLLDVFWRHIDPTDPGGQFADRGRQYATVIYYHSEEQKRLAEASKKALDNSGQFDKPIVTEILPAATFSKAETYHQNYCQVNPLRYELYRSGSGRDRFLEKAWTEDKTAGPDPQQSFTCSKPDEKTLREQLSPLQYKVTQQKGTEPPFNNTYWDNERQGIYVDIVTGEPLFSSLDKFDSGTGWPTFAQPLEPDNLVEVEDHELASERTEVRSKHGDSHLGHVFPDGPAPTGLRYCINSAALRFIPVEELEKEGYGRFLKLFSEAVPDTGQ